MAKTLYLECSAGISGDMTVAALLDLGADEKKLQAVLDSLPVEGFRVKTERVKKAGLDCCSFHVLLDEAHENRDHDMEYLHGHERGQGYEHTHENGHEHEPTHGAGPAHRHEEGNVPLHKTEYEHSHEIETAHQGAAEHEYTHEIEHEHLHEPAHEHSHGIGHEHRTMAQVLQILSGCRMTERARKIAERIVTVLAEGEAKAHGVSVSEVHFHEVGAVDSIVDIVSAAVCLDDLGITEVIVTGLCEGSGTIRCQHGILPIPVPAVANIVSAYGIALEPINVRGEFVTPTGAAIVAAVRTGDTLPERFVIKGIGLGAGKRSYERPSILRAMLIEAREALEKDTVCKLETNIDDCTGEALGYVMEKLLQAGAKDVFYLPVYMKKNRPAWMLNVICEEADRTRLEEIIFRQTTTIGIRRTQMERTVLQRTQISVASRYGEAQVKVCEISGGRRYYPEYESVARICGEKGLSFGEVYQAIAEAAAAQEEMRKS